MPLVLGGAKEAKLAKEKRDAHYPTPEEPQRCIVCRDMTATISCMECPNKACQACIRHKCSDKGEPFLYFHHRHCLRLAHRAFAVHISSGCFDSDSSGSINGSKGGTVVVVVVVLSLTIVPTTGEHS